MEIRDFIAMVPNFSALSHPEKIKHFGWFLHTQRNNERFKQGEIRACYVDAHIEPPNITKEFRRLEERNPRQLLRDPQGYRLEHRVRQELDRKYGTSQTTVLISDLLRNLLGKISDDAERLFLSEALSCYRVRAFRAAIVMTWNLAYDHVLNWLLADAMRLSAFNSKIAARVGQKRAGIVIGKREDFEDLKESEVLDICGNAGVLPSDNIKKILDMQLTKRNLAAHPSLIEIDQPSADETVFNLVANVMVKLS
jgi:hypothetical protein